jgi:hypothetical protein
MKREDIINELGNELKHQRGMQRKLTRLLADVSAEGSAIDDKALSHRTTGILVGDVLKALSAWAVLPEWEALVKKVEGGQ